MSRSSWSSTIHRKNNGQGFGVKKKKKRWVAQYCWFKVDNVHFPFVLLAGKSTAEGTPSGYPICQRAVVGDCPVLLRGIYSGLFFAINGAAERQGTYTRREKRGREGGKLEMIWVTEWMSVWWRVLWKREREIFESQSACPCGARQCHTMRGDEPRWDMMR